MHPPPLRHSLQQCPANPYDSNLVVMLLTDHESDFLEEMRSCGRATGVIQITVLAWLDVCVESS